MSKLDSTRLRELLDYKPETGVFTWLVNRSTTKAGSVAGHINKAMGYYKLRIDGKIYWAHRVAWLYAYGKWPENQIDHINGIRHDNRIANIRSVTHSQNMQNLTKARSESGLIGAWKQNGKWSSRIRVNGKEIKLGYFESKEKAHEAYITAKRELHPFGTL